MKGAETTTAVEAIIDVSRRFGDLTADERGAGAARRPALGPRLAGVSLMGGGVEFGNVAPGAEFNIWADPEAAAIVFDVPLMVCPLDATHDVLVDEAYVKRVRGLGLTAGDFVADVLAHFGHTYADVFFGKALGPLHDPCAVSVLTHPELSDLERLHVEVATGSVAGGMTVPDRQGVKGAAPPNAAVAVGADGAAVLDLVAQCVQTVGAQ